MKLDQVAKGLLLKEFVSGFALAMRYFFKPKGHDQLPLRDGASRAALSRRARAAPLSER